MLSCCRRQDAAIDQPVHPVLLPGARTSRAAKLPQRR
jgi:hypothetical protein